MKTVPAISFRSTGSCIDLSYWGSVVHHFPYIYIIYLSMMISIGVTMNSHHPFIFSHFSLFHYHHFPKGTTTTVLTQQQQQIHLHQQQYKKDSIVFIYFSILSHQHHLSSSSCQTMLDCMDLPSWDRTLL
jgi:hypothetical protein